MTAMAKGKRKTMTRFDVSSSFSIKTIVVGILVVWYVMYHAFFANTTTKTTTTTTTTRSTTTRTTTSQHTSIHPSEYSPSSVEHHIMKTLDPSTSSSMLSKKCAPWQQQQQQQQEKSPSGGNTAYDMSSYLDQLKQYQKAVKHFPPLGVDIRTLLRNHHHHNNNNNSINHNNINNKPNKTAICDKIDLKLSNIFTTIGSATTTSTDNDNNEPKSQQVQYVSKGSRFGSIEPLLPLSSHPKTCRHHHDDHDDNNTTSSSSTMELPSIHYLIHDFSHLCRHHISSYSQIIYFDLGSTSTSTTTSTTTSTLSLEQQQQQQQSNASSSSSSSLPLLGFHFNSSLPLQSSSTVSSQQQQQQQQRREEHDASLYSLFHLYKTFGFQFDHVYAFESFPMDPNRMYKNRNDPSSSLLELMAAYHWINVPYNHTIHHRFNPFTTILQHDNHYQQDDYIVLKISIDMHHHNNDNDMNNDTSREALLSFLHQLLENERLMTLVDQFYIHLVGYTTTTTTTKMSTKTTSTHQDTTTTTTTEMFMNQVMELCSQLRHQGIATHIWI